MTTLDRVFSYFPLLLTVASFAALGVFARHPSPWSALLLIAVLYLIAPLSLRVLQRWTPVADGISQIGQKFSPWLASHNIQAFYDALPQLEALLRVIPGFYSMWLRLWGSRVGYGVEWAVNVSILDRNLMDIGNRVVFARQVELAAHVRKKLEGGGSRVLVRPVRIGSYAFLGAAMSANAGANIPANAQVPAMRVIGVNEIFGGVVRHPIPEEAEFAVT